MISTVGLMKVNVVVIIFFTDSDEEVNAQEIYSQIFPLSERNDKGYRRLDTKRYKVPSFFGTDLTEKMKNAKTLLSENEYKAVYRKLADSIEIQTLHPHPDSIRFVVDTTLARFQNHILDKKEQTATNAIFYSKLKRIMEYKRRVAKQQFSSKGGRVKNVSSFDNQGPTAKKTRREVENDAEHATVAVIDVASYSENIKKLIFSYIRSFNYGPDFNMTSFIFLVYKIVVQRFAVQNAV
ncbi:Uncharacterized protein APZ42_006573 [Daphnia magna]|uniref:Uncharacterized protein n=1 Tax=Daphnia magna TaxID=35525 RepID=A0A164FTE0_9CRUS|nr:Uncharacterized protein APZ42_006573 [Daphnia magna]